MEDRRNIVIATLLMLLILFGWPIAAGYILPPQKATTTEDAAPDPAATASPAPDVTGAAPPRPVTSPRSLKNVLTEGNRVIVQTPKVSGSINLKGARIDDILLTAHRVSLAKDSPAVRLLSPSGAKGSYFASFGWAAQGVAVPGPDTLWQTDGSRLTPATPVKLQWDNQTGQRFEIALTIDRNYLITAKQTVSNSATSPVTLTPYATISRTGKSADLDSWTIHVGPMGVFDGSANYDWDYDDVQDAGPNGVSFSTTGGWIGFTDQYWLTALVPDQTTPVTARMIAGAGDVYNLQLIAREASTVAPGQQASTTSRLFAGAKETNLLDDYVDRFGIPKLDYAIDWGWFRAIEKPFFYVLYELFAFSGNFGVAIILLTILIRIVLFPIAQKQFASMAGMRAIQPKQKVIQERYKDDKPRQQQEMMKLFKEEKVNPLAGCLPIFLQIPIFFALYKVLMLTIEMRHQPFILWIKDLSAPDPLTPVNLFGLLPFQPPAFLLLGVLPILLGVTMWLQQKLNPAPTDPVQKQVFAILPWVLMFVMAPFAAGLQLYWVTNNVISIAQQKWFYMRHPVLREQAAKEREDKAREVEA